MYIVHAYFPSLHTNWQNYNVPNVLTYSEYIPLNNNYYDYVHIRITSVKPMPFMPEGIDGVES